MASESDRDRPVHAEENRKEFLFRMYDQMFNDINTHILVVWQSVGVLIGAFAIFALVEKQILSVDLASAIVVLISAWLIAHLYDSSYWYNRNLVIIANIERQFLKQQDLRQIHYYFGKHRKTASMLTHLRIQYIFGIAIATLVLLYHFLTRVLPEFRAPVSNFDMERILPYLVLGMAVLLLACLRKNRMNAYQEFLKNSPGIEVDTKEIEFGVGHPSEP